MILSNRKLTKNIKEIVFCWELISVLNSISRVSHRIMEVFELEGTPLKAIWSRTPQCRGTPTAPPGTQTWGCFH